MSELKQESTEISRAVTLAAEINAIKDTVKQTAVHAAIEIGKRLKEAKSLVPYGSWGKWLEESVDYSERTAQNLMALAEEYKFKDPQAIAGLPLTKAVLLLGVPGEERDAFVQEHKADEKSVRELKAAIEQLKAEKQKQQLTIEELMGKSEEPSKAMEAEIAELKSKMQESRDRAENLRADLTRAGELAAKLQADKETWKQDRARLEQENAGHEKTIERLTEELKKASEPMITTADRPETLAELEKLRAERESAGSIAAFRVAFEAMKRALGDMEQAIGQMDETNSARYRQAAVAALKQIEGRMENA